MTWLWGDCCSSKQWCLPLMHVTVIVLTKYLRTDALNPADDEYTNTTFGVQIIFIVMLDV